MWSFAWGVTHHQYCILTTCLAVTTPSYCAVENRSKSEGSCTVYKNKAYLVVIFPLEPEARSIDDKTTETGYTVELDPSLCVVQSRMLGANLLRRK